VQGERISELDGLRGIAVLLVVAWHYLDVWHCWYFLPFRLGWSGVDLFFVLSGCLIGGILLDHRNRQSYFKPFYGRRVHRIFPLYYLWIAIFLLGHLPTAKPRWCYLLFAQNLFQSPNVLWESPWIGHTWSLAVEEQFYLIAPLLIRFVPLAVLPWLGGFVLLAAPLCRFLMPASWPEAAYVMTPCRADALAMGVIVAGMMRNRKIRSWLDLHPVAIWVAAASMAFPMAALMLTFRSTEALHPLWYSAVALTYSLVLLAALVHPPMLVSRVLGNSCLAAGRAAFFRGLHPAPAHAGVHSRSTRHSMGGFTRRRPSHLGAGRGFGRIPGAAFARERQAHLSVRPSADIAFTTSSRRSVPRLTHHPPPPSIQAPTSRSWCCRSLEEVQERGSARVPPPGRSARANRG